MELLRPLVSLLAPPRCAACGAPCGLESVLCRRCGAALEAARPLYGRPPTALDAVWSATSHDGVARELVAALKFRRLLPVAELMALRIATAAPPQLLRGTIVPVPAAPLRLLRRGFDPADELAARLAALAGLPLARCLNRGNGPRQVGRTRAARVASPPRIRAWDPPRHAVLVDDVQTTGATLCACAAALRRAGTAGVVALTFARAL